MHTACRRGSRQVEVTHLTRRSGVLDPVKKTAWISPLNSLTSSALGIATPREMVGDRAEVHQRKLIETSDTTIGKNPVHSTGQASRRVTDSFVASIGPASIESFAVILKCDPRNTKRPASCVSNGTVSMTPVVRAILIAIITIATVSGMVATVRWAKRGGPGAAAAGTVMLALGSILAGKPPPDHDIEQLRDDKGRKGNKAGGPPAS